MSDQGARIVDLWIEGLTVSAIARELQVTKNTISGRVARMIRRGVLTGRATPTNIGTSRRHTDERRQDRPAAPPPAPPAPPVPAGPVTLPPLASVAQVVQAPPVAAPPSGGCRFPLWSNNEPPTHQYCNARTSLGSSYCASCRRICFYRARAA